MVVGSRCHVIGNTAVCASIPLLIYVQGHTVLYMNCLLGAGSMTVGSLKLLAERLFKVKVARQVCTSFNVLGFTTKTYNPASVSHYCTYPLQASPYGITCISV